MIEKKIERSAIHSTFTDFFYERTFFPINCAFILIVFVARSGLSYFLFCGAVVVVVVVIVVVSRMYLSHRWIYS